MVELRAHMFFLILLLILVSLPAIILGYLIAVKQKRQLMPGWDDSTTDNPEAFARLIGGGVLFMGMLIAFIATGKGVGVISDGLFMFGLVVASLAPTPCLIIAHGKYGIR